MIDYIGSLQRMKDIIGDVDSRAVSSDPQGVMKAFTRMKNVKRVLSKDLIPPSRSGITSYNSLKPFVASVASWIEHSSRYHSC